MEALAGLINADVLPVIPGQGSVGASGDLAPLAHMSLVLIGEGEALVKDKRLSGAEALKAAGIAPVALGPKEGLSVVERLEGVEALWMTPTGEVMTSGGFHRFAPNLPPRWRALTPP